MIIYNDYCAADATFFFTCLACIVTSSLVCRDIPQDVIDALIKEGEVFFCAGGLMVESPAIQSYREPSIHPCILPTHCMRWMR